MNDAFRSMTAVNLFIVPILGINRKELLMNGLENAYIKDEIRGIDYPNSIYLLFRPFNSDFEDFVEKERKRGANILDEYDHADGWTVLVYGYDSKWQEDVDVLMTGKFSKVSEAYKKLIPRTKNMKDKHGSIEKSTIQHSIFNKEKEIKDYWKKEYGLEFAYENECWEFYTEREILTQEMLEKMTIS